MSDVIVGRNNRKLEWLGRVEFVSGRRDGIFRVNENAKSELKVGCGGRQEGREVVKRKAGR